MGNNAQNGRGGQQADGPGFAGVTGDRVADAVADLYGADPQAFTERRKALGDAARAAGDTVAAKQIAALRKPTRAAWVVNRLARDDEDAPARLASLAAELRAAEQARDGPRLRELSAARGPLIDGLTAQALAGASVADPPAGLRDEVAATLTAALADPEVAAAFEAGTLTRAAQWAGFGLALPGTGADTGTDTEFAAAPGSDTAFGEEPAPGQPRGAPPRDRESQAVPRATPLRPARPGRGSRTGAAREAEAAPPTPLEEGRRLREGRRERERLAREESARQQRLAQQESKRQQLAAEEAAQAAARRRKIFDDAERGVASATATAEDAAAAEDRLEEEVRTLEQRLTRARAELADARMRARRAETAERKARQTLDRLPRPEDSP